MNTDQELIVIENLDPARLFAGEGLDELLTTVEKHVKSIHHDISTATGRKSLASFARKIAGSKTSLDLLGKNHVDGAKKQLKAFDANRKKAKDFLQALQDETRKPLTEWEVAEAARAEKIADRIEAIKLMAPTDAGEIETLGIDGLEKLLLTLQTLSIDEDFEEMAPVATAAKEESMQVLTVTLERLKKQAEEKAELDHLRTLEAEQKQKAHDEQIRKQAQADAEAKLERERTAAIEAKEKAERDTRDALEAVKRQKEAAEHREKEAKLESDRRAKQAAQDERDRIAAKQKAEADVIATRERNTQHRGRINRAAADAIAKICIDGAPIGTDGAKKIVTDITKGKIPNVIINY